LLADEAAGLTALHEELLEVLEVGFTTMSGCRRRLLGGLDDCTNMK